LLAAACLACAGAARAAEPPPPDHSIRAPHYGDVLFRFYQDQTFDALTTLMVSQQQARLGVHADEAELLRGGLLLSYGMHRQAGEVFGQLIERGTSVALRNRAWYYLARVRYARGDLAPADAALARIEGTLPEALDDERRLLLAQIKLGLGDAAGAAAALQPLATAAPRAPVPATNPATPDARPSMFARIKALLLRPFGGPDPLAATDADARLFARFNLGVALLRQGDSTGGQRWLDALGQMPAANEEQRALRDRANLALGFAALQAQDAPGARRWLERVRLQGPSSNKALLGFGWAAMAQKQPRQALVPWQLLAERDDADAAVLEARIAVPHALAELGADEPALAGYQQALQGFDDESARLQATITALRSGPWLQQLLQRNPGTGLGWTGQLADLPALPHTRQLAPVLASHAFQEGFKTWRDLRFLQANLNDWLGTLGSYRDMLAQRQARFEDRSPSVRAQADRLDLAPLQQRHQALTDQLAQAQAAGGGLAFANDAQQAQLQRVARSRATLADAQAPLTEPQRLALAERLRLASGALLWDLAQAQAEHDWATRKALQASATGLAQAAQAQAALAQAQRDEAERFVRFGQRINALAQRINALLQPLAQTEAAQGLALQQLAIEGLQDQQARLAGYRNQARFAMAQLHDRARLALPATPATPAPAGAQP
jgi:hypothetical protein